MFKIFFNNKYLVVYAWDECRNACKSLYKVVIFGSKVY
jgi:hypothetical protein